MRYRKFRKNPDQFKELEGIFLATGLRQDYEKYLTEAQQRNQPAAYCFCRAPAITSCPKCRRGCCQNSECQVLCKGSYPSELAESETLDCLLPICCSPRCASCKEPNCLRLNCSEHQEFTSCEKCKTKVCEDCNYHCEFCGNDFCQDCLKKCSSSGCRHMVCPQEDCGCTTCQKPVCATCSEECTVCDNILCSDDQLECGGCGHVVCKSDSQECPINECDKIVCNECKLKDCHVCDQEMCGSHIEECSSCGEDTCEDCMEECEICKQYVCKECHQKCEICEKEICKDCQEDHPSKHQEEGSEEEQPSVNLDEWVVFDMANLRIATSSDNPAMSKEKAIEIATRLNLQHNQFLAVPAAVLITQPSIGMRVVMVINPRLSGTILKVSQKSEGLQAVVEWDDERLDRHWIRELFQDIKYQRRRRRYQ